MIGDLIGKPGRVAVEQLLPGLREERGIDFVTANGENVAGGMGLTPSTADAILFAPASTSSRRGNHIWDKREIYPYLESNDRVLRPLNYGTHDVPGRGWGTYQALDGTDIAVINLQGRTYMQPIENPFTDADRLLDESSEPLPPVRLVDFHCELTSEKNALGLYLDGRVSVVVGTHTHVVTGDERILPGGTAYQTDLGMTGPVWSVIGFDPRDRPAALHQRPADPVRGRRGAGGLQRRPDRHRSGDRPRPRDRADPAPRRGLTVAVRLAARHDAATPTGAGGRSSAGSVDDRPPHAHDPLRRRPRAGRARRGGRRRRRPAARDHRPRHPRRVPRARRRGRRAGRRSTLDPGRRDQRHRRRATSALTRASSTSWASGWIRPTRRSRRRSPRQRAARRLAVRADRRRASASSASASTTRSRRST